MVSTEIKSKLHDLPVIILTFQPVIFVTFLQATLQKVLGLTVSKNAALACDPLSGIIAYPAG